MENDISKKVAARFEELPELVQHAIRSADFDQKMQVVVQKHKLHIDQAGALGDETLMVMMGFSAPAEFADNIEHQLHLSKEQSEALAQDVSNSLFVPIREAMQEYIENKSLLESLKQDSQPAAVTGAPMPAAAPAPVPQPTPISTAPQMPPAAPTPQMATPPTLKPVDTTTETMLSQKTASVAPPASAPAAPPTPAPYKADPYREPPE